MPASPVHLGRYRLIIELAQGGMGKVYLAVAQGPAGFSKLSVIKELKPSLMNEPGFLEMFLDEARLSARLNHPNVVQTNEVSIEDGRAFLAMEYLEGQSLNRVRTRLGADLRLPTYLRVIAEACAGLHYAHELRDFDGTPLNVVHRDVSPDNIIVTYDGQVKLLDFGIAKALSSRHQTAIGIAKGKLRYMAPEQLNGTVIDRRADIFAMGAVVWEAVAGVRMWKGMTEEDIVRCHAKHRIPKLTNVAPDADPRLVAIVDRATAYDRDERFETADELRSAIDEYLAAVGGGDHSAMRELGAAISVAFEAARSQVSNALNARLKLLRESAASCDVGLVHVAGVASGAAPSGLEPPAPSSDVPDTTTERIESPEPVGPAVGRSRARPLAIALASGVACALGVAFMLGRPARTHPLPEPTPASPAQEAPLAPPPPGEEQSEAGATAVHLTLRAKPKAATIFFDDAALPSNPHTVAVTRDTATHRVRAVAPGYEPKVELVSLDGDATILVELVKISSPSSKAPLRRPAPVTNRRPPSTPPSAPTSSTPRHRQRPIDTSFD